MKGSGERSGKGSGNGADFRQSKLVMGPVVGADIRMVIRHLAGIALLQDQGRRLLVPSGVPRSGPVDAVAHLTALRLVGSSHTTPTIEFVGRLGFRLEAASQATATLADSSVIAACGDLQIRIDGVLAPAWTALECPLGRLVEVSSRSGFGYLSLAGGPRVQEVLGAAATCLMGGLGPEPLHVGQHLELAAAGPLSRTLVGSFAQPPPSQGPLRVVPGPHGRPPACRVAVVAVDRIGVRCTPLKARRRSASAQLPSLGVLPGAIQMLPSGDLVFLGPDSGTMGGYPVVGVVAACDIWRLGRVSVGEELELLEVTPNPDRLMPRPVVFRPIA